MSRVSGVQEGQKRSAREILPNLGPCFLISMILQQPLAKQAHSIDMETEDSQ